MKPKYVLFCYIHVGLDLFTRLIEERECVNSKEHT